MEGVENTWKNKILNLLHVGESVSLTNQLCAILGLELYDGRATWGTRRSSRECGN